MSIDVMKQALEAVDWLRHHLTQHHGCLHMNETASGIPAWLDKTETALRAAIEQAQEPVGWFGYDEKISTWFETNEGEDDSVPLYAGARGWEGLTPEETVGIELSLRKYHDGDRYDLSLSDFARAIEARLKEKNV